MYINTYEHTYTDTCVKKQRKKVRWRPIEHLRKIERERAYMHGRFIFMNPNDSSICINACID